MPLTVPNEAATLYAPQAALDQTDIDVVVASLARSGVVSGCAVTAHGASMSVDVAAGVVEFAGGTATVAFAGVTNVTIGAAGAADRRDLVVINTSGTVSVTAGTAGGAVNGVTPSASRDPMKPAIPANSVVLAEVYVAANTTTIVAGNITDKRVLLASSHAGLETFNAGLTVPSGQSLTTGTRAVVTGTRATTTNASDTVNLGTFSTTGGAIELRIHAHLAAPGAGTTASVTKVYEIAANATMGTLNTWYLCLPSDASANAAATNDFALEVERTALNTFVFRFRQKSIGIAGSIAFVAETLGDTVVTFTPSTTITAAPAAVTTPHPSNAFVAAAGNIGVGTEAPAHLLDVAGDVGAGPITVSGLTGATSALRLVGATVAGPPTSGTFLTGDVAPSLDGNVYICTAGGSPGTWQSAPAPPPRTGYYSQWAPPMNSQGGWLFTFSSSGTEVVAGSGVGPTDLLSGGTAGSFAELFKAVGSTATQLPNNSSSEGTLTISARAAARTFPAATATDFCYVGIGNTVGLPTGLANGTWLTIRGDGSIGYLKRVSSASTTGTLAAAGSIVAGDVHDFRIDLRMSGGTATVYLDGVSQGTIASAAAVTAGNAVTLLATNGAVASSCNFTIHAATIYTS